MMIYNINLLATCAVIVYILWRQSGISMCEVNVIVSHSEFYLLSYNHTLRSLSQSVSQLVSQSHNDQFTDRVMRVR